MWSHIQVSLQFSGLWHTGLEQEPSHDGNSFFSNLTQASAIFFPLNICVDLTQKAPKLGGVTPPCHFMLRLSVLFQEAIWTTQKENFIELNFEVDKSGKN